MKKIFIVDDSQVILLHTKGVLEKGGYEVFIFKTWTMLYRKLRDVTPDLVMCDVDMPGMQGDEVLGTLKRVSPDVKMIFHSSKSAEELTKFTKERKADGFICKGTGEVLLQKVKGFLPLK